MPQLTPTTIWLIRPEIVTALDERLGPPVDSYVNGSQTWLTDDGPGGVGVEWRLQPVAGYRAPKGGSHYDLFESVVAALAAGAPADALPIGQETRSLAGLWDGLECYPAYGDDVEPQPLAAAVGEVLGIAPDHAGLVDHEVIATAWEQTQGKVSIVSLLVEQLTRKA